MEPAAVDIGRVKMGIEQNPREAPPQSGRTGAFLE